MIWKRVILAWMTLLALVFASAGASARTDVDAKPHVGAINAVAPSCIEVHDAASAGVHQENWVPVTTETSDVPDATKGIGNAVDDVVRASTPVGRRGAPLTVPRGTNVPTTIGGRNFTGHALDQMQSRGFTPTIVENAVQNGIRSAGNQPGTFQHIADGVKVITNEAGGVITVIPR
jgi:hypothetical protein